MATWHDRGVGYHGDVTDSGVGYHGDDCDGGGFLPSVFVLLSVGCVLTL